jgi:hypothetical protein
VPYSFPLAPNPRTARIAPSVCSTSHLVFAPSPTSSHLPESLAHFNFLQRRESRQCGFTPLRLHVSLWALRYASLLNPLISLPAACWPCSKASQSVAVTPAKDLPRSMPPCLVDDQSKGPEFKSSPRSLASLTQLPPAIISNRQNTGHSTLLCLNRIT